MTEKVGRPTDAKQDEWEQDLHPQPQAGLNHGLEGMHPEKADHQTAYDIKELHNLLQDYTDEELRQIVVLPPGHRLEQNATYLDLADPGRGEFKAMGVMMAEAGHYYVPKSEMDYVFWNRLRGVSNPERLDRRA